MRDIKFKYYFTNHAPVVLTIGEVQRGAIQEMVSYGEAGSIKATHQYIGITIKDREIYKDDVYRHVDGAHFQVVWNEDRSGWDYLRLEDGSHMYEYYDWGLIEESEYIGTIYE